MSYLKIKNLSKTFHVSGQCVEALQDINLQIDKHRFLSVVGPSGCGKTTLLRIIAGLEKPTGGKIVIDGNEIAGPNPSIGFVFQEYALLPWRTAQSNVAFGPELKGIPRKTRLQMAAEYLSMVGLQGYGHFYPYQLSGGMKQRVAIARTLINEPKIILMDEPFSSIDAQTRNRLQGFLSDLWQQRKDTIIFVTHNVDEAIYLSDRIVCLSSHPSAVAMDIPIEMSFPRERTGVEFNRYRRRVLEMIARTSDDTAS